MVALVSYWEYIRLGTQALNQTHIIILVYDRHHGNVRIKPVGVLSLYGLTNMTSHIIWQCVVLVPRLFPLRREPGDKANSELSSFSGSPH